MSEIGDCQSFPLPQVAEALKPYIKTRQEVLHIRRVLSLYLASHIEGLPNGNLSPISLASPSDQVRVKRIPLELTGVRRDYLLALQAHNKAKEKYAHSTSQIENLSRSNTQDNLPESKNNKSAAVSTYLDRFEAQQKHEKLTILRDYVDKLAKKDAAQPEYLTLQSVNDEVGPAPESTLTPEIGNFDPAIHGTHIQALTTRLEKALLRANSGLQREKALLAEAKEKYRNTAAPEPSIHARIHALTRTRDELVWWLEEKLAKVNETEDRPEARAPSNPTEATIDIEQRKAAIQKLYKDYLDILKSLIMLASKPRTVHPLGETNTEAAEDRNAPEPTQPAPTPSASTLLPPLTAHLLPALDAQTSLLDAQTHISRTASHQTLATDRMLQKLAHESHLLANYPHPRSQNKTTEPDLLASPPFGIASGAKEDADIVDRGRAWAFAAEAARMAQKEVVGRKLRRGEGHAVAAKGTVLEIEDLLWGVVEGEEGEGEDVWNEGKGERGGGGAWSGVDGKVGVDKGKA